MSRATTNQGSRIAVYTSALLSLAILITLGLRLDWRLFLNELQGVHWPYLPVLILLTLATFWVRALRWRHLLPHSEKVSRTSLFEATLVGFTATFILPLRIGEIIRPWVLSRWQPVKFSAGLASIVTERAFDALTLMAMLGLTFAKMESVPPLVSVGAKVVAILSISVLAVIVTAYLGSAKIIRLGERLIIFTLGERAPTLANRLVGLIEDFLSGLRGISSLKDLSWSIFWSVVLWALLALLYQIGLWSFGLTPSPWVGITVCVMIALAVAAPGAPGFVGTFQLGCVVALALFDFSEEFAVAYSIVLHVLQAATVILAGFMILHRRGLHLTEIREEVAQEN